MFECYIRSNKNAVRAREQYFEKYFDRRQPSLSTFKIIYDSLGEYVSFTKPGNKLNTISEVAEINTLAGVIQKSSTSTWQVALEVDLSQRTVVRVLKKHKYHPYKLASFQTLHIGDLEIRFEFCTWFTVAI